ncbi:Hypothetical_protein [Hexamita inflata]|uniref:Hypothetical_protein n=1 Tax=Hexamita inflata TaxID=28002 RepID=A0AA86PN85_9EUKA|nr:Hypothetical protein HINF_LOCUS30950 [Hexamita inflata]
MTEQLIEFSYKIAHKSNLSKQLLVFDKKYFESVQDQVSSDFILAINRIFFYVEDKQFMENSIDYLLNLINKVEPELLQNSFATYVRLIRPTNEIFQTLIQFAIQKKQSELLYHLLNHLDDSTVLDLFIKLVDYFNVFEARLTLNQYYYVTRPKITVSMKQLQTAKQILEQVILNGDTSAIGLLGFVQFCIFSMQNQPIQIQFIPELQKINQVYKYIFDYELIPVDPKTQPPYLAFDIASLNLPLTSHSVIFTKQDGLTQILDKQFVELLNYLNQSYKEYSTQELFVLFNKIVSFAVLFKCYSSEFRFIFKFLQLIQKLLQTTYVQQNTNKYVSKIMKMFTYVPIVGTATEEMQTANDFSFYFDEQLEVVYEEEFCKNMGIIFGKQLQLKNMREFVKKLLPNELKAEDSVEQIPGLTQIPQYYLQYRPVYNNNYKLVAALGIFLIENFSAFEQMSNEDYMKSGDLELIIHSIVKTMKHHLRVHSSLSEQQVLEHLQKFVTEHKGEKYSIAFLSNHEDLIKNFLLFQQNSVEIISGQQTRIALPDLYLGYKNYHVIIGLESQILFSTLLISSPQIRELFFCQYFRTAPDQTIFYMQPILSIIFQQQSSHLDNYLQSMTKSFQSQRNLLRNDSVFKTFAACLECVDRRFSVLQFIFCFISQFGGFFEMCLLLVQNRIRWENSNKKQTEEISGVVDVMNPETGTMHKLTRKQFNLYMKYFERLYEFIMQYMDAFIEGYVKMSVQEQEFNLDMITDFLWQKRRLFSQIQHTNEENYDNIRNQIRNQLIQKLLRIKTIILENPIQPNEENEYRTRFDINIHNLTQICLFFQNFSIEFEQIDPRAFKIDQKSAIMLNPRLYVDNEDGELLECYQYQIEQIQNYYKIGFVPSNWSCDRFFCALIESNLSDKGEASKFRFARVWE